MFKLTQEKRISVAQVNDVADKDESKHMIAINNDQLVRKFDVDKMKWHSLKIEHGYPSES